MAPKSPCRERNSNKKQNKKNMQCIQILSVTNRDFEFAISNASPELNNSIWPSGKHKNAISLPGLIVNFQRASENQRLRFQLIQKFSPPKLAVNNYDMRARHVCTCILRLGGDGRSTSKAQTCKTLCFWRPQDSGRSLRYQH